MLLIIISIFAVLFIAETRPYAGQKKLSRKHIQVKNSIIMSVGSVDEPKRCKLPAVCTYNNTLLLYYAKMTHQAEFS